MRSVRAGPNSPLCGLLWAGVTGTLLVTAFIGYCAFTLPLSGGIRLLAFGPGPHRALEDHLALMTSTVIRFASISALRRKASSILRLISLAGTRGLTWIVLVTPFRPFTRRTALSAADRFERDPAVADEDLDLLGDDRQPALDCRDRIAGDFRIRPLVEGRQTTLGANAGLLAASALMIDYVLNVAVGTSAGIGALTSAVPQLHPYTLELCLSVLTLITIVNLRGTLEAGVVFSVPTYLFVASLGGVLLFGAAKALAAWRTCGSGRTASVASPSHPDDDIVVAAARFCQWLHRNDRVEAVSNGVSAFQDPAGKQAHRTLTAIVLILAFLLGVISWLCPVYGVHAIDETQPGYQSVLSQLTGAIIGRGVIYFVAIGSLLAVLCLSANTSFIDFPRLCRLVARDGYLPRTFAIPGRRLVYSVGILWLAVMAGLLLTVFGGITDRLIPLFAVGAFMAFTLSQLGMAFHWVREQDNQGRLWINGTGAAGTGLALAIILFAKFVEGAWITVLVIPLVLGLLKAIKRHYELWCCSAQSEHGIARFKYCGS